MQYAVWLIGVLLALGFVWPVKLIWFKPFNINHFFERIMVQFAWANPEILTMLRVLERLGYHGHNKKLNNESDRHQRRQLAKARRNYQILQSYDRDKLTAQQQLSYDIMAWFLKNIVEGEKFMYHNYPVNQLFGVQNQLPTFMATIHQVNNERDARYYIIRLSKFREKFLQVLEGLKIREQKGIIPPQFVCDKVLAEMDNFISAPPEQNILYTSLKEKLEKIPTIGDSQRKQLLDQARQQIGDTVYPAYQLLVENFTALRAKATTAAGVWKFPAGDEFYQYLLRRYTTTELTAEEIHTIGLREVTRIQEQMQEILAELGYTGKPPVQLMHGLSQDPRFKYPDTDQSRHQVLKDYQAIIDRVDKNLDHLFNIRPKARVIVERIPEFKEKTAPGAYYNPPAVDGSRPGLFSVNLLKLPVKFDMETLAYHEAIPGHHFQLAIQQELKGLPIFRKFIPFTAYAEGWALYAEKLAYENNLFSDQYSVLGYLASELFRAARLVVDTGLHYKRWTREQAIEYMVNNTCSDKTDVVIEVERYIVMPGQATAYKVGELEILRLRNLAREKLKDAFEIKEFHDVILQNGAMPLKILAQVVEEYIAAKCSQAKDLERVG